ncbi:MAG TPA: hypothetical protein DCG19_05405 [Cryomorphaceae bacterium]|nr:hypothetical protein [Owenweeksia sp.]MBF98731.1 hypothetical protein [Owenweeksia sp.]HAD96822.1 hypothetical protein [Cryomorphaceae bacterium]HBF19634.1 hypothetical protein [Cryomorphaceae bacterium]
MKNESSEYYKSKATYSIKWNSILSFSNFLVSFVVSIVLARLLDPKDFGLIAMTTVFVSIISLFVDAGTGSGVIQKKEINQTDLSTVFFYNLFIGFLAAVILFVSAPAIALFYEDDRLVSLVRTLSLSPLLTSLSVVQKNVMNRTLELKKRIIAQVIGQVAAAIVGISLALLNYGVWALVFSSLCSLAISSILYWVQGKWMPSWVFNRDSFNEIWSFSKNILYGNIISQFAQKMDILLIGKFVNPAVLGFYQKGRSLGQIPANQIGVILTRSYFPILSRLQHDLEDFRKYYLSQSTRIFLITFPLFTAISLLSENIIVFLYGAKWLPSAPFLALTGIVGLLYCNNAFKVYACNALGRSYVTLRINAVMSPIRISLYLLVAFTFQEQSPILFLSVIVLTQLISTVYMTVMIRKHVGLDTIEQYSLFYKIIAAGLISLVLVFYLKRFININPYVDLPILMVVFVSVNVGGLLLMKERQAIVLVRKIKSKFGKRFSHA